MVQRVKVRLVTASERSLWNSLMKRHHSLGVHSLIGQSLKYVAVHKDRWLALLGWGAAAFKCKVRDEWISRTEALKLQRLPLVATNCRFLILPKRCQNASQRRRVSLKAVEFSEQPCCEFAESVEESVVGSLSPGFLPCVFGRIEFRRVRGQGVQFNALFLSLEPLSYFRTFVIFGIVENQRYLFPLVSR